MKVADDIVTRYCIVCVGGCFGSARCQVTIFGLQELRFESDRPHQQAPVQPGHIGNRSVTYVSGRSPGLETSALDN
jgi:hypothetical protein